MLIFTDWTAELTGFNNIFGTSANAWTVSPQLPLHVSYVVREILHVKMRFGAQLYFLIVLIKVINAL